MTPARLRAVFSAYPRSFWAIVVGTFVNRTGLVVLPFLALYLTSERGIGIAAATWAVSLYGAGAFAGGLLGGVLADRIGRRPVLLLSLAGAALPVAAIPFAPGYPAIAAMAFAFGLVGEMYRPAVSAVVADTVEEARQPQAFAIVYWAINLGSAVGPALGGWIAATSFTGLFVLEGVTLLGYAVIVLVAVPESRPAEAASAVRVRLDLRPVARDGTLAALAAAMLLVGMGFFQLFSALPLTMAADGLTPLDYGLVVTVNCGLIVLIGLPVAAFVGARLTSFWMPAGVALIALGLAATAGAHTFWAYAAAAVLWTVGETAFLPIVPTLVARIAPVDLRGSYQGVYHASWGLAKALGPGLGGLVLAGAGAAALWLGAAALSAVAAVLLVVLIPTLRRRLATTPGPSAGGPARSSAP